jgi:hypothetical protein
VAPAGATALYLGGADGYAYAGDTGAFTVTVTDGGTNIDSVEITQAIQEFQPLSGLQYSLQLNGEPPVPIVAYKPAVLRCYFQEVQNVTSVTIRLSGVSNETKTIALQPNCADVDQRAGNRGCQSMDFYFTPPSGNWQAILDNLDSSGNVQHEDILNVKSVSMNSLLLRAVSVCDTRDSGGTWQCANPSDLSGKLTLLSKIAPTNLVWMDVTDDVVRENVDLYLDSDDWWTDVVRDVAAFYGFLDSAKDYLGQYTTYLGMVRPAVPGGVGGKANAIPSHGAAARSSVQRLGVEANTEVIAHETGHTLGLKHTNTQAPAATTAPPGCYNLAEDKTTDWGFPNNDIQSAYMLEYGFDVATRTVLDPTKTFDLMSYCVRCATGR